MAMLRVSRFPFATPTNSRSLPRSSGSNRWASSGLAEDTHGLPRRSGNMGQAQSTVLKRDLETRQALLPKDSDTSGWRSDRSQERNVSMLGRSIETLPVEVAFNSR